MGDERQVSIILKLKQQLNAEFGSAAQQLENQIKAVNSAHKELQQSQERAQSSGKSLGASFVDMAAKLYLAEVAFRKLIEVTEAFYGAAKEGAQSQQIESSFQRIITMAGGTVDIIDKMRESTHGTVSELDMMKAVNQSLVGSQGEFKSAMLESIPALTEIARASSVLNPQYGDTAAQLNRITESLKKRQPNLLDEIGIEVKLTETNRKYAEQMGITGRELTSVESQVGLLNEVLERGNGLVDQAGIQSDSATDSYTKFEASLKNLQDTIEMGMSPAVADLLDELTLSIVVINNFAKAHPEIIDTVTKGVMAFLDYGHVLTAATAWVNAEIDAEKEAAIKTLDHKDAIEALTDQRREEVGATEEAIKLSVKLSEEQDKVDQEFREQRDKSLNNLFLQQLKINQKIIDATSDRTEKIEELESDHNDRINRIARDGADDRTRIAQREADDKAQIEQDYADRKAGLEKDLNELQMELEGKNPYVDEATTQAITDQEALLKATKSNLETLKRDAKNGHAGPSMDAEIQATEDLIRQTEDNIAQLKESAREQERRRRLEERIKEKQDEIKQAAEKKDRDLKAAEDKAKADIELSQATEKKKTDDLNDEYNKRRGKIEESFNKIKESAQQDLEIATVDSMLSIVDASSDVGKALTEMKFKQLGGTDEMINKFYQLRDSITGPGGVLQAIQMMNSVSVSSLNTGYYNNSGNYSGGISGRRAGGGSVSAGHSYLVGENGPEVLQMGNSSGHIIPNGGGGGTVVVNINAGAFLGNRSDAVAFGNMVGPIIADWQSRYGGATNARGTRNIRSNR